MGKARYTDNWADDVREQMDSMLSALEKEGANKEKIEKYRKGYLREIKSAEAHEKEKQAQIAAFLKIIRKENCPIAAQKLRQIFYSTKTEGGTWKLPIMSFFASMSMQVLESKHITKTYSGDPDYKRFHKKITGLRDSLRDICQYMNDPDIRKYYEAKAYNDDEVSAHVILKSDKDFFRQVQRRGIELDCFLYSDKKPGRPSLKEFYNFVYQLARTYEEISGQKFTVLRHRESTGKNAGEYVPITPGHEFIYEAVRWTHEEFKDTDKGSDLRYTDKNIYNACEQAQKKLKNGGNKEKSA